MSNIIHPHSIITGSFPWVKKAFSMSEPILPFTYVTWAISPVTCALTASLTIRVSLAWVSTWVQPGMRLCHNVLLIRNNWHVICIHHRNCNLLACCWVNGCTHSYLLNWHIPCLSNSSYLLSRFSYFSGFCCHTRELSTDPDFFSWVITLFDSCHHVFLSKFK